MKEFYVFKIASQSMCKKRSLLLFVFLLFLFASNSIVQAQTLPQQITYQGKLVENGIPFSGSTTMIFELINPTTNTIEWTETQTINIQDGLYSVVLGSQTAFAPNFFSQNPSLGLRVSVNGNALTPITILRAVPYAHAAGSVSDNSITSLKITNGTIQTIDIATGGQNKILATDGNGQVVWIDRVATSVPSGTAGGDLVGVFPNPTIADGVVTNNKISPLNSSTNQIMVSNGSSVTWEDVNSIEVDPKINLIASDIIPRWDGTQLVDGSITDDGSSVNISTSTSINELNVGTLSLGGFDATSIKTSSGGGVLSPFSDVALVSELAMTDYIASQTSTFENGLGTLLSGNIGLGGTLTENTSIDGDGNELELTNMNLIDLQSNGDITLDALGNVEIQPNGGNIEMGDNTSLDSELILNGWLNLPSLDPTPSTTLPNFNNLLYADNTGNLFWGSQNLSAGTNPWTSTPNSIFYQNAISRVGIGAFSSTFEPLANLHIRKIATSADLKITTLRGGLGQTSKLYFQSAADNGGIADASFANDILGEVLFEGHNGSSFQEAAKIDVLLTDASTFENKMRFSVDGIEKMYISENEVEITQGNFWVTEGAQKLINLSKSTINPSLFNFTVGLGTTTAPSGGQISLTSQSSIISGGQGGAVNILAGQGNSQGGDINLTAGNSVATAGSVSINGGFVSGLNTRGFVRIQNAGGDVIVGNGGTNDSELQLNGWLNLPDQPITLPTDLFSSLTNNLYAQGGNLFWGSTNLSAGGSSLWEVNGSDLYYENGTVGIGDFLSLAPEADLHIKRIGTGIPANIRLTSANGTTALPTINAIGDIIGEMVFEGFSDDFSIPFFREAGKIDMITTANTALNGLEADMRFTINNAERMRITNDGNVGIGNFPALSISPSADLHILSLNTEASLKLSRSNGLTATDNSDVLGTLAFEGTNNNLDAITAGKIDVIVDGTTSLILPSRMVFSVNDNAGALQERMRITKEGMVIIGDIGNSFTLTANSNPAQSMIVDDSYTPNNIGGDWAGNLSSVMNEIKLVVDGRAVVKTALYSNATITTSDMRLKKNIQTLQNPLSNILKMRGVSYNWRTEEFPERDFDTDLQVGLIAQEVAQIYPEAVEIRPDGYLSVNYPSLVPVLIEATKEQQTIIDNQKEEIKTQKIELENLKKQISELKEVVASLKNNENSNSALAQKVEALEKQLTALVESLSNKTETTTTQTASLKEEE